VTTGFNFLERPELPAPQVSEAQAQALLAEHYGLTARAESLGSQQDRNFLVWLGDDAPAGVLKVANAAFSAVELEAQDAAAALISAAEPTLRVAAPLPNRAGAVYTTVTGLLDGDAHVRLLPFLAGGTLVDAGYLSPTVVAGMGELAGRISRTLCGFTHPGLDRTLQWDLRHGNDVVTMLAEDVADPVLREDLRTAAAQAWQRVTALADALPTQAVHLDLTDANIVMPQGIGTARPDGVIDFGDLSDTWAVCELAVTLSSVLGHPGASPSSILPGVKAFHAIRPLSPAEADALWPLLVLRTAVLIVSGAQQTRLEPDNAYLTGQADAEARMFAQATSLPSEVMSGVIRAAIGLTDPPVAVAGESLLPALAPESVTTLDLSTTSDIFDRGVVDRDGFGPQVEDEAARAAVRATARSG
jgi:Ser/Thr protein kinase RdoA (MazF antagonist)